MDFRKVGIWMVIVGGIATAVGLITDAARHADDPTLSQREGVFDFGSFPHALFFGGIAVAIIGLGALVFGDRLYASGARVTVGRRMLQVAAPLGALALIAGCAAAASDSSLGEAENAAVVDADGVVVQTGTGATAEAGDTHTMADGTAMTGTEHSQDEAATEAEGHAHDTSGAAAATVAYGEVIPGTASGDSPCEIAQPTPASPGQVGAGTAEEVGEHGHRGMVKPFPLTQEERVALEAEMTTARTVVDQFPTVEAAEAGGYHRSTPYVPCIGAHYTNVGLVGSFDPLKPSELLYDGTKPDSKLVGLSYLVLSGDEPPAGFAGKNDPWHQHNANGGLCFQNGATVIGGEELTEEECAARGGTKRELAGIWMMHAWVVPGYECSWGVFAGECPELGGRVAGTQWDEPAPDA